MALRTPLSVTPHLYMGDSTGRPLDMGTVYFGEQDKDPEFYPIDLFSDDELTLPLAQPVHTKGGYLYDKGDMVEPHAKELIYSVKVLDSYGRKVFYKGEMMRNSWNDDVIEQINAAIVASTDIARQIATDITNDAINNTAIDGGVLADTFVTATANGEGTIARTQRDKNSDFLSSNDYVPKNLDESADATPYLQAASDKGAGATALLTTGETYNLRSSLLVRPGGIRGGASGGYTSKKTFQVYEPIRQGRSSDNLEDRLIAENGGWYSDLKDLAIYNNNPAKPAVINNEAHFVKYYDMSIRGKSSKDVPLLKLGGTLYTQIHGCDFGDSGDGDGISAIESNYDVAYYGTNASWFSNNNFNVKGTAFAANGIFSFRDSTIEGTVIGKPKIQIGEAGKSASVVSIVDNTYFECAVRDIGNRAPLIRIDAASAPRITNCHLSIVDYVTDKTTEDDTPPLTAVDFTAYTSGCTALNYNHIKVANKNPQTNTIDLPVGFNLKESAFSHIDFIGNVWHTYAGLMSDGVTYGYDKMYVFDGTPLKDRKSIKSSQRNSFYIRDNLHGIVKQRMAEKNIWSELNRAQEAEPLDLGQGKNLILSYTLVEPLTIKERDRRCGTEFRVLFLNETPLKHSTTHTMLSAKKDLTVPARTIIEFVVDHEGIVREIGTVTSQILADRSKPSKGTTAQRPESPVIGQVYYDTTLLAVGKPISWAGTAWVDALGATV